MKILYTIEEYNQAKNTDKLPCQCAVCESTFFVPKKRIIDALNPKCLTQVKYCSIECANIGQTKKLTMPCTNCQTPFTKQKCQVALTTNHFCSRSCAATYNNRNKTKGNRRSKLETYLESALTTLYPDVEFHFNRKDAINSELDIYIPKLKLAFELNGIFHYEPIYGQNKLNQIQNNDTRKLQACIEQGIEMCLIDTSGQTYFKEQTSKKFLEIICQILSQRLNAVQ